MLKLIKELHVHKVGVHLRKFKWIIAVIIVAALIGCSNMEKEKVDTKAVLVKEVTAAFANEDREVLDEKVKVEGHVIEEYIERWNASTFSSNEIEDFSIEKTGEFTYHVYSTEAGKENGYIIFRVFEHLHTGFYIDYIQFVS